LITPFGIIVFLFLSFIMGVVVGFLRDESVFLLINTFSSFLNVFKKLVKWSLNFLPIALICLFAGLAASFDIQLFMVMFKFIILCCAGAVFIFIICTAIILIRSSKTTVHRNFAALLEPIILTFAGCSSKAVLPSAINCLEKELKFNSTNVNLALPLGIILGRFGNIFYFALCAFFTAQIYGFFFEPVHYFIIFGAVILAGTATAGVSGIITLSMFGIVLRYLNLPLEAVLILLIAIDPVIKPLRTFFNIYVNMACVSLIAKQDVKIIQSTIDNKKLLVFIHEAKNKPPLLTRVNGVPGGIEISFINEIGRRLDRKVVYHDKDWIKDKADIIAGVIIKDLPPAVKGGYYFSHPWTSVNINGVKTQLYFLIRRQRFKEINGIIKTLINENYLKKLLVSLKPKNK
ncbi:MAG: dicarboxylate/amino acid:cation symporter, partial [Treponema sp.]|nr:dicarboxylate/amino acid:cation symporter [Treponema sp.]